MLRLVSAMSTLSFSAEPGSHNVEVRWREARDIGLFEHAPRVDLGSPAVNARVVMQVPSNRWLLWTGGTPWGAVVTLWQYVVTIVIVAFLLSRIVTTPLGFGSWLLLGLGMTQVPLGAPIVIVLWFSELRVISISSRS